MAKSRKTTSDQASGLCIRTAEGYRLIGGDLNPTPPIDPWWEPHYPLAHATHREAYRDLEARWAKSGL